MVWHCRKSLCRSSADIEVLKPLAKNSTEKNELTETTMNASSSQQLEENVTTAEVETSVKQQPKIVSDIGEKERAAETQNESSLMNYEEAEVKEGEEVYEAEMSGEESLPDNSNDEEDADFTATIPYIPKNLEANQNPAKAVERSPEKGSG